VATTRGVELDHLVAQRPQPEVRPVGLGLEAGAGLEANLGVADDGRAQAAQLTLEGGVAAAVPVLVAQLGVEVGPRMPGQTVSRRSGALCSCQRRRSDPYLDDAVVGPMPADVRDALHQGLEGGGEVVPLGSQCPEWLLNRCAPNGDSSPTSQPLCPQSNVNLLDRLRTLVYLYFRVD
jgi:hypothetical protein